LHAIKQIRKYLDQNHSNASAKTLAKFARELTREGHVSLADLYGMSYEEFELAVDLLKDWRFDRYYADKTPLFDLGVRGAEAEQIGTS
jgi:hypothetical protein